MVPRLMLLWMFLLVGEDFSRYLTIGKSKDTIGSKVFASGATSSSLAINCALQTVAPSVIPYTSNENVNISVVFTAGKWTKS